MDKRTAIEWLAGYTCSEGTDVADTAALLAADVDIPLADATKVVVECEELLKELFNDWQASTPEETDEEAENITEAKARENVLAAIAPVDEHEPAAPAPEAETKAKELNTNINPDA